MNITKITIHRDVREYDIHQCNINILYKLRMINQDTYMLLKDSDKQFRQYYIGKFILQGKRDNYDRFKEEMDNIMNEFKFINNLRDEQVIIESHDAIFTSVTCNNLLVDDYIRIVPKNKYSIFIDFSLNKRKFQLMLSDETNEFKYRCLSPIEEKVERAFHGFLNLLRRKDLTSVDRERNIYSKLLLRELKEIRKISVNTVLIKAYDNETILELLYQLTVM